MSRALPRICAVALVVAMCLTAVSATASAAPAGKRVILVLATGLSWGDLEPTATPTLYKLAATGAIGNLNAHPRVWESPPSAIEGALGISAGNWIVPDLTAEGAYDATESVDGATAADVFRRTVGGSMRGAAIAYLGLPPAARATTVADNAMVLGALGQVIRDAGGSTAAVGNSDAGDSPDTLKVERPAALAAMDASGLVQFGDVSADLLTTDVAAPYGQRTDLAAFKRAVDASLAQMRTHGGPALLVLDPGDAYRALRYKPSVSDQLADDQRVSALKNLDAVVALALNDAGADDTVIVSGQAPQVSQVAGIQGFSPLLVSGPGMHGFLTSSTTHRAGMVSNPDINATVLQLFGLTRPVEVIGSAFAVVPDSSDAATRIHRLSRVDASVTSVDSIRGDFIDGLVRSFAIMLLAVAAFLAFGRHMPASWQLWVRRGLMLGAIAIVTFISAGWVMFLFRPTVGSPAGATLLLCLTALAIISAIAVLHRYAHGRPRLAPAVLLLGTSAIMFGDQLVGSPLSVDNLLGYTPLGAVRYYGIGNEAAAFMLACGLIGSALLIAEYAEEPWAVAFRRWGAAVWGFALVIVAAAPAFGANVGVAVWGTAGVLAAWAGLNGRKLTWKLALVGVIVIVLLVGGFLLWDLYGHGTQTHLARSVSTAEQGGISQLTDIVVRKAQGNGRILFGAGWWFVALGAAVAFLAFERVWGARQGRSLAAQNPEFFSAVVAVLVAGVTAFFSEDTGVLLMTVMSIPLAAMAAWLALTSHDTPGAP